MVIINNNVGIAKKLIKLVRQKTRKILTSQKNSKQIEISFIGDKAIRKLNKKFRKLDRATDVLSFEMEDEKILGDVIISIDRARANAKRFKVTFENEIIRLVIHGVLHLLGYDHKNKNNREEMRKLENKFLSSKH